MCGSWHWFCANDHILLGVRPWKDGVEREGSWEKDQRGWGKRSLLLSQPCCSDWPQEGAHTAKRAIEVSFFCLLFSRVAPERHLPNEAFYFPVLAGFELLAGRRKEDCGHTLGIKINLIFIGKNNLYLQPWQKCDRDFLAERNLLVHLLAVCPVVVSFHKWWSLFFKLKKEN